MTGGNYDWLDGEYVWDTPQAFGYPREELRLAEQTFSLAMPNKLLLRLFEFIEARSRGNRMWEVVGAQTTELLLRRMEGGPLTRPQKYKDGFDYEDFEMALAAVRNDELPNMDLLDLCLLADTNAIGAAITHEDRRCRHGWKPVLPLVRERIVRRMHGNHELKELDLAERNGPD